MVVPFHETIRNLESSEHAVRIKKVIFCVCHDRWINDIDILNNLSIQTLVEKLYRANSSFDELKQKLYSVYTSISKSDEYRPVVNLIIQQMERLYTADQTSIQYSSFLTQPTFLKKPSKPRKEQLVILELHDQPASQQEIRVSLEVVTDNGNTQTRIMGKLLAVKEVIASYQYWQRSYRNLGGSYRLGAPSQQTSNISSSEQRRSCYMFAQQLKQTLHRWYDSPEFSRIRERLFRELEPEDEVRLIIRTHSQEMWQIPWHLFFEPLLEHYLKAEVALSLPEYERVKQNFVSTEKVNILAILGSSKGINVEADRQALASLPNSRVVFLVEPQREQLNDTLWERNWNIFFFAGHSYSQNQKGHLFINETESLTIEELKYALRHAINKGMQLAIFNSCDGLDLARELTSLRIPQLIVMREPVPDQIAQGFLKIFLKAFSQGKSLYGAVREARERLQPLEKMFPGATWLPIICQNPTASLLTWNSLLLPAPATQDGIEIIPPSSFQTDSLETVPPRDVSQFPNSVPTSNEISSTDTPFYLLKTWGSLYFKFCWILLLFFFFGQLSFWQLLFLWSMLILGGLETVMSIWHGKKQQPKRVDDVARKLNTFSKKRVEHLASEEEENLRQNIQKYREMKRLLNQYASTYQDIIEQYPEFKEVNQTLMDGQQRSNQYYQAKVFTRKYEEQMRKQQAEKRARYWDKK